jgi:hypothetical protein
MALKRGDGSLMDSAEYPDPAAIALRPNGNGHAHTTMLTESQHATVELLRYWNLLWAPKWIIIGITLAAALSAGMYTRFCKVKLYRAEAVITPTAPGDDSELGLSSMGGLGGAGGLGMILGFGGAGDNVVTAQRYIAIMQSYDFGVSLAKRHGLAAQLSDAPMSPWQVHKTLNGRFSSDYDYKSGNLTLYFIDPEPARAKAILGLYLDSLRDKLRNEAVQTASAAALSLQDEVRRTPDALLQNQLYELMAHQIQREKLAQVQANFAFKVVDPPVVPDNYYAPSAHKAAVLTGALALFALCGFFILREWLAAARIHLEIHSSPRRGEKTAPIALVHPLGDSAPDESARADNPVAH